ncbi:MAG: hypothetical protein LCH52_08525 [Bacteroidetes bacterium]|nr:hypothetical protein [Bacteroidota bacterium]
MELNNFKLLTDGIGLIYLPDNSSLVHDYEKHVTNNMAEGSEMRILFEKFQDEGWIHSYKKFNDEKEGFFSFKTKNIRVYGLLIKGTNKNYFIISEVFIKQNKPKEHNNAIKNSKKRLQNYEYNIQRIYDNKG